MADLEVNAAGEGSTEANTTVTEARAQKAGDIQPETYDNSVPVTHTYPATNEAHFENQTSLPQPGSSMSLSSSSSKEKVVSPLRKSLKDRKYLRKSEWPGISRHISNRARQGKQSEIYVNNRRISLADLQKNHARLDVSHLLPSNRALAQLPDFVVIKTPLGSPSAESVGDTNNWPNTSQFQDSRGAPNDNQVLHTDLQESLDNSVPRSGSSISSYTLQDGLSLTDSDDGASNPGRQSPGDKTLHHDLDQDQSQGYPHPSNQKNVDYVEARILEVTRSVKATIQSAEMSEDRLLALEGRRLLPVLAEIQSCLQQSDNPISICMNPSEIRLPILNRMKLAMEASTAAEWDWWPLQPPRHPGSAGRAELSWQCSCGIKRHESTLPYYANELKRIFDNFPLSPVGSSGPTNRPPIPTSSTSSQGASSTQSLNSFSTNSTGRQRASISSSTANSTITPADSVVDFGTGPRRYIYVFLLIKASEYTLDTIDVGSMKAWEFFQTLRTTYIKHRGLWRQVFSVFVYSHCDFIKIIKPEPDTFMPGELKFELPSDHDDEYHYRPRPTYSALITRHMFRHYFYGCFYSDTISHRLHSCLPLASPCRIRNPAEELLEYLPKRDRKVSAESQSDKVEVCYGLVARERRSFFRVVVYLGLIVSPAFWFVFAWLLAWGDRGDLQNATVPMTLVLALLSIFWAMLHSGSDVRKDYGDGA